MVLRKSIVSVLAIICFICVSCLEVAKEISDWTTYEDINDVEGTTHYLSDDGIKLFLPTSFRQYSTIEYLHLLDSLVTNNKDLDIERTRIKHMREMEGNHYIFFDSSIYATYYLNSMPYRPISRQDAKFILGVIRESQREYESVSDLTYEKITAKHNDNGNTQIFKAIFRIENQKMNQQMLQHAYIISSNEKTVMINLMSPFEIHFDPFLEKMIL